MFYYGRGVVESDDEAVKWYRLAAAQGQAGALYHLGLCYANDRGVPQDYAAAIRLYKRAAAKGHAEAAALVEKIEAFSRSKLGKTASDVVFSRPAGRPDAA
jgi:TPR repeat protein